MKSFSENIEQYIQDFIGNGIYDIVKFFLGLIVTNIMGTGLIYSLTNKVLENIHVTIIVSTVAAIFSKEYLLYYIKKLENISTILIKWK